MITRKRTMINLALYLHNKTRMLSGDAVTINFRLFSNTFMTLWVRCYNTFNKIINISVLFEHIFSVAKNNIQCAILQLSSNTFITMLCCIYFYFTNHVNIINIHITLTFLLLWILNCVLYARHINKLGKCFSRNSNARCQ